MTAAAEAFEAVRVVLAQGREDVGVHIQLHGQLEQQPSDPAAPRAGVLLTSARSAGSFREVPPTLFWTV